MVETEGGALVVRIDRPAADQIDQSRKPRPKRPALQGRAMRERDDGRLRRCRRKCAKRRRRLIVDGGNAGRKGRCHGWAWKDLLCIMMGVTGARFQCGEFEVPTGFAASSL